MQTDIPESPGGFPAHACPSHQAYSGEPAPKVEPVAEPSKEETGGFPVAEPVVEPVASAVEGS
jgi:hypothetical protein